MTNKSIIIIFIAILFLSLNVFGKGFDSDSTKPTNQLAIATSDLVNTTNQYITSIKSLILIYERKLRTATDLLKKRKELYAQGIVSKQDLELSEQYVKAVHLQLDEANKHLTESVQLLAETKAEEEVATLMRESPPQRTQISTYRTNAFNMRYSGSTPWSLAQAGQVQYFFASQFGRQLPISAYGQSATHNRMGFDHHNAMDVAVNPDSPERKALIAFLRRNGIPYLAFRSAVPGAATGAHIHIGFPSHRL